jgi:hypothetical protein
VTGEGEAEGGAPGESVDEERAGGESSSRAEHLGGTGNPPEASRSLGDPGEHPEQHAARQTGGQAQGEPQEETENDLLDSEEHSEAGGSFGTAEEDGS